MYVQVNLKTDFQPGDRVKIKNVQARHVIVKANEPLFKGAFVIKKQSIRRISVSFIYYLLKLGLGLGLRFRLEIGLG